MPLSRSRLALIGNDGNSDAPRLWAFKTDDVANTVDTVAYFNSVRQLLKVGDVIMRVTVTNLGLANEAVSTWGFHIVLEIATLTTDVSDPLVGIVADNR